MRSRGISPDDRRHAVAELLRATARVAAAPAGTRHATALAEACGLARFVVAGSLSMAEVSHAVGGGLVLAGKAAAEGEAIVRWAVARLASQLEWML